MVFAKLKFICNFVVGNKKQCNLQASPACKKRKPKHKKAFLVGYKYKIKVALINRIYKLKTKKGVQRYKKNPKKPFINEKKTKNYVYKTI